jgi:hypothetical protein
MAVLRGAERILRQDRPNLILELEERHVRGCVAATFDFLEGLGYRGFVLEQDELVAVQPARLASAGLWNYVFRHPG